MVHTDTQFQVCELTTPIASQRPPVSACAACSSSCASWSAGLPPSIWRTAASAPASDCEILLRSAANSASAVSRASPSASSLSACQHEDTNTSRCSLLQDSSMPMRKMLNLQYVHCSRHCGEEKHMALTCHEAAADWDACNRCILMQASDATHKSCNSLHCSHHGLRCAPQGNVVRRHALVRVVRQFELPLLRRPVLHCLVKAR